MRNKETNNLEIRSRLLPKSQMKKNISLSKIKIIAIVNIAVLFTLIIMILYFKHNYQSINSNYNNLTEEYNQIMREHQKYNTDIKSTQSNKDKALAEYQSISMELQSLTDTVNKFSNDITNTKSNLLNQKNKSQSSLDKMYSEYNKLASEAVISSLNLNKAYFPFSNLKFNAQGKEYQSNILRSMEEIEFIERITNYKLDQPCYRTSQSCLMGQLFRNYCKDVKPNVSLYLTDKNNRFGGFTQLDWGRDEEKFDITALLFNLDSRKVWKATPGHKTIDRFMASLPSFGEGDITCSAGEICTISKKFKSFHSLQGNDDDLEINGGHETFRVLSLEVYLLSKP